MLATIDDVTIIPALVAETARADLMAGVSGVAAAAPAGRSRVPAARAPLAPTAPRAPRAPRAAGAAPRLRHHRYCTPLAIYLPHVHITRVLHRLHLALLELWPLTRNISQVPSR